MFFLRNPTCYSGPTVWTTGGWLANSGPANSGPANFLTRQLWVRRTWGQPGSRPVRVGSPRIHQRGSLKRPMNSEAWTSRVVDSPAALCLAARVFETLQIEKQEVGALDRAVQPIRTMRRFQRMRSAQRIRGNRKARHRNCLGQPRWRAWTSWESTQSIDRVSRGACRRNLNRC